jgi:hypothetical protein
VTFSSEEVRLAFHQLPAAKQLEYEQWEHALAKQGRRLHITSVIQHERLLDIGICISENREAPVVTKR